ncbi:dTDP-4-dehydrorhamnose reductase [Patescibacteria group bacterium]|nr:dTDP-4-dehydrorhamnose reductase [Patescibacteria group bacterium]
MKTIVILGKNGMLGKRMFDFFIKNENYKIFSFSKNELDITDFLKVQNTLKKINPDFLINCTAYTKVDEAENNRELAFLINSKSVLNLAKICSELNTKFVHFSTDYVFSGKNKDGYCENNEDLNPLNIYGKSKLKGEKYIQEISEKSNLEYYIIRTSWLFDKIGNNFVNTILKLAKNKKELNIINDQFGSPTYTLDLINFTNYLILKNYSSGIYHFSNSGCISWYNFAKKICEINNINIKINPVSSNFFKTEAKRPKYSYLIDTKTDFTHRVWNDALIENFIS